jgi:hypothetical protein
MKKGILLFCLFLVFNVCYSYEYRLPENSEYYLNVNTDKNIGGNTYDKVKRQINTQYKGKLERERTRPEFNMFEYGYYLNIGLTFGMTDDQKVKNGRTDFRTETDFDLSTNGTVALGIFWYNGFRMEIDYAEDNKKPKHNFDPDIAKYGFNLIYENYAYERKFTPYIGVGTGIIQGKKDGDKDFRPMAQGLIGFSYKFENQVAFYTQFKHTRTLLDLNMNGYKMPYVNNAVDVGFRIFLF